MAIHVSLMKGVILLTFGDMLRVPINNKGVTSLLEAKKHGADVRFITSPFDAIRVAIENLKREVVFFSVGFETTTAPLAAMIRYSRLPHNLSFLISHRITHSVMELLLGIGDIHIDGVIAPGHVSAVTGAAKWDIFPKAFRMPTVIAGFSPEHVLQAILLIVDQVLSRDTRLQNIYPEVVTPQGNIQAQDSIAAVFDIVPTWWRGIGRIPESGYKLRGEFAQFEATKRFGLKDQPFCDPKDMLPGCSCHLVVMGKVSPNSCPLFGGICTPESPAGPCMVSQEGTCYIWWKYRYLG
jgi:hydrogenase expression/formation protein HypD